MVTFFLDLMLSQVLTTVRYIDGDGHPKAFHLIKWEFVPRRPLSSVS
jgi:hypothetical protein